METIRTFFALLGGIAFVAAAQPPVLYSNMPQTASMYTRFQGDPDAASELIGLGSIWTLDATDLTEAGTAYWGPAAGSTYASLFSAANWLLKETWPGAYRYRYYAVGSAEMELVGEVAPGNTTVYSNFRSILFFPMYLNDDYYGGYQVQGGSIQSDHYSYTATGTLTLGQNSYTNVIQIYGDDGVDYWHADPLYPIVRLETVDFPFQWIALMPGLVDVPEQGQAISFAPYPNPSTGLVRVDRSARETSYSVVNMLGEVVLSGTRSNEQIDLTSLRPGPYEVRSYGAGTVRSVRVVRAD